MDEDVMGRLVKELDAGVEQAIGGSLCSGETDCSSETFSKDCFHKIDPEADPDTKIVFIDGGNAELFSSPDSCAHFIRIFHTIYRNNKRISCSKDEFYVLCQSRVKDGSIVFSAKLFPSTVNSLTDSFFAETFNFNPLDANLTERNSRMTLERVPGIIRRIAEISTALILASEATKDDIIVIDGDLCPKTVDEKKLITALSATAKKTSVSVCALSKTSNLLTSTGISVAAALSAVAPHDVWFYSPAARRQETIVSFAKLNPKTDYVFKLESFDHDSLQEIIPILASNSTDAVFLGYPYGLIEADRFARVSNREREMLRTTFTAKAGKDWHHLESKARSLDAHSVLDSI